MKPVWFVLLCALATLAPFTARERPPAGATAFPGWPAQFEGVTLEPLPLSPIEQRFQDNFPGRVGRFTDGRHEIILRWVESGTRKLHPGSDCFKAGGYALTPRPILLRSGQTWSVFEAHKGSVRLEVRERIIDSRGAQWSDVSAWYWAVQMGQTTGPWLAVTVARNVDL